MKERHLDIQKAIFGLSAKFHIQTPKQRHDNFFSIVEGEDDRPGRLISIFIRNT
jgi:hypothetical protein